MPGFKVALDKNALLRCISRKSAYSTVLRKLYRNQYELSVTTGILLEYEEKIEEIFSRETAELIIGSLLLLPNVKKVDPYFHLNLISDDWDDNKFVDCAFAANVHIIVTDDKHFSALKKSGFPQIQIKTLDEFKELIDLQ